MLGPSLTRAKRNSSYRKIGKILNQRAFWQDDLDSKLFFLQIVFKIRPKDSLIESFWTVFKNKSNYFSQNWEDRH